MGLLFLTLLGILAIIGIARLASKMKRKEENDLQTVQSRHGYESFGGSKPQLLDAILQKGLIALLLKKKIIGEEELLEEINRIKNNPET